jgi:Zn-finger nucleic acid-binding protein
MTREHRLILGLDDVRAVRWKCPKCGVEVNYVLTETVRLPDQCPSCHDGLMGDIEKVTQVGQEFVRLLKRLREAKPQLLSLEVADDPLKPQGPLSY